MSDLLTRDVHVHARAAETDTGERAVYGLAVPYGETITVWGQRERLAPGSVEGDGAKLFERHREAVGIITAGADSADGWEIKGVFSDTAIARDAYNLTRDGVYDGLSIGFEVLEYHYERDEEIGDEVIVYDRIRVREVSLVPFPAYPSATVTEVRTIDTTPRGTTMPTTVTDHDAQQREAHDIQELREQIEDHDRLIRGLADAPQAYGAPEIDTRSAGAWLRDLARGDESSVREYEEMVERAYVGDTIRLFNSPDPLSQIFATGQLPAKGLKLEYGVLKFDTVKVEQQEKEGDDLTKGAIKVGLDYADIHTYGGHVELTRQQIERTTNVNVLDLHIRALGLRGATRKAAVLRGIYADTVTANSANPDRVVVVADQSKYLDWIGGIVDAAERFMDLGLPLDALLVDKTVFKTLAGLSTNNRPLMAVTGSGPDQIGQISATQLGGNLAGVTVRVNLKQTAPGAAFVNSEAIRQYNSPVTELADENIVNLSKRFGLYYYAANAVEIPDAIVPVVATKPQPAPEG